MILPLLPHPQSSDKPVATAVSVTVAVSAEAGLELIYRLAAPTGALFIPPPGTAARRDGLWQTTCAECFIAAPGAAGYREFNASPSGAWAVYDFAGPRQRLADPVIAQPPRIDVAQTGGELTLHLALAPALLPAGRWQAAISVVAAGSDGALAYWALAHPAPMPDFHHRDGFRLLGPSPLTLEPR